MPYQPTMLGTRYMVSAGHYLATQAGFNILEAGGNAVDAGVAAGMALAVVQSDIVNCGGVAPMIIYLAETNEVVTISGLGWWPKAAKLRDLPARAQRPGAGGRAPLGHAGRARRLAHRAQAFRHHELRRGRGSRDPLCARRLPDASDLSRLDREVGRRLQAAIRRTARS